jgi:hypothetical protein
MSFFYCLILTYNELAYINSKTINLYRLLFSKGLYFLYFQFQSNFIFYFKESRLPQSITFHHIHFSFIYSNYYDFVENLYQLLLNFYFRFILPI